MMKGDDFSPLDSPPPPPPPPVPTRFISIQDITLLPVFQVRKVDRSTVYKYATTYRDNPDLMPPITVATRGEGFVLLDGWHRFRAMEIAGAPGTNAIVLEGLDDDQMEWEAAKANLTHGRPLKAKEVREVFRRYVRTKQHKEGGRFKSYRDIARDLGSIKSHTTLRNWMKADFPKTFAAMGESERATEAGAGSFGRIDQHLRSRTELALDTLRTAFFACTDQEGRGRIEQGLWALLTDIDQGRSPQVKREEDVDF